MEHSNLNLSLFFVLKTSETLVVQGKKKGGGIHPQETGLGIVGIKLSGIGIVWCQQKL